MLDVRDTSNVYNSLHTAVFLGGARVFPASPPGVLSRKQGVDSAGKSIRSSLLLLFMTVIPSAAFSNIKKPRVENPIFPRMLNAKRSASLRSHYALRESPGAI